MDLLPVLEQLIAGRPLSQATAGEVISSIMRGEIAPALMAALLTAWRCKGETVEEIVGAAEAMRAHALRIPTTHEEIIDTCGTGGDQSGSFNISTTTAFVVAGAGVAVAKHGNRSASSRCGSIDLLEQLGVNVNLSPESIGRCLDEAGIAILFARVVHPAMRHAAPVRTELGIRTIFNWLGPLTNPAKPAFQLVGISNRNVMETYAACLQRLGIRRAWVVCGMDGLDEITLTGPTAVLEVTPEAIAPLSIDPESVGLKTGSRDCLKGGTPEENARITRNILSGEEQSPRRDAILLNAGAALHIAGKASSPVEGIRMAADSIDSGKANKALERLITISRRDKK